MRILMRSSIIASIQIKEGITWTSIWDFVPYNTEGEILPIVKTKNRVVYGA